MMKKWMRSWMTAGVALAATSAIASAQAPAQQPGANPAQAGAAGQKPGDLPGPIDSLTDVQDTGRMLFAMADTNHDNQISQKEAVDVGNLVAGGFFFRADQNGDGVLSQEEANTARQALFAQQPMLRYFAQRAKATQGAGNQGQGADNGTANPVQALGSLLDTNNDKQLQAAEVRQAVNTAVQGLFAMADTNRDNNLSPTEINAAIIGAARTAAQAAFQQADADNNGSLSRQEFDKAIIEPANAVFAMLDLNGDGQLSPEEAQQARRFIASQLRALSVPEPPNSARNLLRTGAAPDQVAPVPGNAPPIAPRR